MSRFIFSLSACIRRRGDYKLIIEYELVITEPEATNCFSINFQVNIRILNRKFMCLFALYAIAYIMRQSIFCKIQARYKLKTLP